MLFNFDSVNEKNGVKKLFQILIKISFPLIISELSVSLMTFIDRAILSRHSLAAVNGVVIASEAIYLFLFPITAFVFTAEVIIGQFNGEEKYKEIPKAVWQMIWFSILISAICIPLAFLFKDSVVPDYLKEHGTPYFITIMSFLFVPAISGALSTFFLGTGNGKVVLYAAIFSNLINYILDVILVLGIKGKFNGIGALGAAIATVACEIFQMIILLLVFFKRKNREKYGTHKISFNILSIKKCFSLGMPYAIMSTIEMSFWFSLTWFFASISASESTILNTTIAIYVFFMFVYDGLKKGFIAVGSNLIGAKRKELIPKLIKTSLYLNLIIAVTLFFPMVVFSNKLLLFCLGEKIFPFIPQLKHSMFLLWLNGIVVSISFVSFSGILYASGDVIYITVCCLISVIFTVYVPTFILNKFFEFSAVNIMALCVLDGFVCFFPLYLRYKNGKWYKNYLAKNG